MELIERRHCHTDAINAVCVFGNGAYYATASRDKSIRIWQTQSGLELMELSGHNNRVTDLWVNREHSRLYSCGEDKTLRIWDLATGFELATLRGHENRLLALMVDADERWAVTAGRDGLVKIWDLDQPEAKPVHSLEGHQGWVTGLALDTANGARIYSGARDGRICAWDVTSGEASGQPYAPLASVTAMTIDPASGSLYVATEASGVEVLDITSGKVGDRLARYGDWVTAMVVADRGESLVWGDRGGRVLRWNLRSGELVAEIQLRAPILTVELLDEGRVLAGDAEGSVAILG